MAVISTPLAASGTTGNNTHAAVGVSGAAAAVAVQFIVEAAGAGPTVTWKAQGSLDGTNWFDVYYVTDASDTASASTKTATGTGAQVVFLNLATGSRFYSQFRLVTTLNTNITYRADLIYGQRF